MEASPRHSGDKQNILTKPKMTDSPQRQNNETDAGVFRYNRVASAIDIAIAVLIGWGISMIPDKTSMQLLAGITSGIMAAAFMLTSANTGDTRSALVIRVTAWVFFIVAIVVGLALAIWCEDYRYYILVNGIWLCIFATVTYRVATSGQ